eukprot:758267-Hanusia_phi.AAC.1
MPTSTSRYGTSRARRSRAAAAAAAAAAALCLACDRTPCPALSQGEASTWRELELPCSERRGGLHWRDRFQEATGEKAECCEIHAHSRMTGPGSNTLQLVQLTTKPLSMS